MNGHLVRVLIEYWNSDTKSFKIGRREVPFSLYDVALITGLPAHGKRILFERSEATGEVEELLKGVMDDHVSRERGRRRMLDKDMRIYRNYICNSPRPPAIEVLSALGRRDATTIPTLTVLSSKGASMC